MRELLWNIIEESKENKPYVGSEKQYENLKNILSRYDSNTINTLHDTWDGICKELKDDEFEKLHVQDGGIVDTGDDGFDMDFANWVIAQGKALFDAFKTEGHEVVLDYIKKNKISEDDYTYECMVYVFQEFETR